MSRLIIDTDESSNDSISSTASRKSSREPPKRFLVYFPRESGGDGGIATGSDVKQIFKFPVEKNKEYTVVLNKKEERAHIVKVGGSQEEILEAREKFENLLDMDHHYTVAVEYCESEFMPPMMKKKKTHRRPPLEAITNNVQRGIAPAKQTKTNSNYEIFTPSLQLKPLYESNKPKDNITIASPRKASTASNESTSIAKAIRTSIGVEEDEDYYDFFPGLGQRVQPAPVVSTEVPRHFDHRLSELLSRPSTSTAADLRGSNNKAPQTTTSKQAQGTGTATENSSVMEEDEQGQTASLGQQYDTAKSNAEKIDLLKQELLSLGEDNAYLSTSTTDSSGEMVSLFPGYAVKISKNDRNDAVRDCKEDPRKLQIELMKKLFTTEYILSHSGSGQRAKSDGCPRADRDTLDAVFYFSAKLFKGKRIPKPAKSFNDLKKNTNRLKKHHSGEWRYPKNRKKKTAPNPNAAGEPGRSTSKTATGATKAKRAQLAGRAPQPLEASGAPSTPKAIGAPPPPKASGALPPPKASGALPPPKASGAPPPPKASGQPPPPKASGQPPPPKASGQPPPPKARGGPVARI